MAAVLINRPRGSVHVNKSFKHEIELAVFDITWPCSHLVDHLQVLQSMVVLQCVLEHIWIVEYVRN